MYKYSYNVYNNMYIVTLNNFIKLKEHRINSVIWLSLRIYPLMVAK